MTDDGATTILSKDHPCYAKVKQYVADGEFDEAFDALQRWKDELSAEAEAEEEDAESDAPCYNEFVCDAESIEYHGRRITAKPLVELMRSLGGLKNPAFRRFVDRLCANPRWESVEQLFTFLAHENLPITSDGCFIGYKAVRSDYRDKHSGSFDNSPGQQPRMRRADVQFDPAVGCSTGLHIGTYDFAKGFCNDDDRLVICKVDPADVVSVPSECQYSKLRASTYLVLCDAEEPLPGYMVFSAKGLEMSMTDYSNARRDEYQSSHCCLNTPQPRHDDDDYEDYDDGDNDDDDDSDTDDSV
jgi:hypothetical protein